MLNSTTLLGCLLMLVLLCSQSLGAVRLPAIVGPGMVLQRDTDLCIWGWASPGEQVTVKLAGQEGKATADQNGRWTVTLLPLQAGGPHQVVIQGDGEPVVLDDVLVGEVWVCSGQSNMQWPVEGSLDAGAEIAAADYPMIRLFTVKPDPAAEAKEDVEGKWQACSPASIPSFSAVGYFFGRHLYRELNVPIGLVNSSLGGTRIEAWTSREMLDSDPVNKPMLAKYDQAVAEYNPATAKELHAQKLAEWYGKAQQAQQEGKEPPAKPKLTGHPASDSNAPAVLYNGMIAPLTPMAMRGVIWYQGESNAGNAWQYRQQFPCMIFDWRERWGRGDLSFLFVQIAAFGQNPDEPWMLGWPGLREAQTMTLDVANTAMVVTMDIGNAADIHPKNKQDVGKRLGLAALGTVYEKDVVYQGPMCKSVKVQDGAITIEFDHADGLCTPDGQPVAAFQIAGEDRAFVDAQAQIVGSTVVVSSPQVAKPVAARYGWSSNPVPPCNLFNAAGLPASPFRTDDWPLPSQPKQ